MAAKKTEAKKSPVKKAAAQKPQAVLDAEAALKAAQDALAADPENEALRRALIDAQVALDALKETMVVAALKVICRKDSFMRCGRRWTKEPIIVPLEDLTEEEVEQLTDEPMLIVEAVEA